MQIRFYNSLTNRVEDFIPRDPNNILMYACGSTVYDDMHIGNIRAALTADIVYRILRHKYGSNSVTYSRNITDIDDKIINKSAESKTGWYDVAERYEDRNREIMKSFGLLTPSYEPRATENIPEIIHMISSLYKKGVAYISGDNVYFDVSKSKQTFYWRNIEETEGRIKSNAEKRNQEDFVLWKSSKIGEPGWSLVLFNNGSAKNIIGRPGWHIECSAMIDSSLGKTIDIHLGGKDLIFPHHENESRQSTCYHDSEYLAKYWIHNEFVGFGEEKISKSSRNYQDLRKIISNHGAEAVKTALLMTRYRKYLSWDEDVLQNSRSWLDKAYRGLGDTVGEPITEFVKLIYDDMKIPEALNLLRHGDHKPEDIRASANILGLLEMTEEEWFKGNNQKLIDIVQNLVDKRNEYRYSKQYEESDRIKLELLQMGVQLEDHNIGTDWRFL